MMPKFQSTINPSEIIEVSEDMARILRDPVQTGWKEFIEKPEVKVEVEQEAPKKKAGRPRKEQ